MSWCVLQPDAQGGARHLLVPPVLSGAGWHQMVLHSVVPTIACWLRTAALLLAARSTSS